MKVQEMIVIAFLLCIASCENTRYGDDFSRQKFDEVNIGDSLQELEAKIGRPLRVVSYPVRNGRPIPDPKTITWSDLVESPNSSERMFRLLYTTQINPRCDYLHCHVSVVGKKVKDKTFHRITE